MKIRFLLLLLLTGLAWPGMLCAQKAGDYKHMRYSAATYRTRQKDYIARLKPRYLLNDKKYRAEWDGYLYSIYQSYSEASGKGQFITEPYAVDYLNKVLKNILDKNNIREKIEVVVTRAKEANAYNMGDNKLYVNIGLFSVLENEAQLAFLLCHELAHQQLLHSQNKFNSRRAMLADKKVQEEIRSIRKAKYNKMDRAAQFSTRFAYVFASYSRDNERAADSMAVELLRPTDYDFAEGQSLMRLLEKSDKDSSYVDLARHFNHDGEALKPEWTSPAKTTISFGHKRAMELDEDSVSTHPDIPARVAYIGARPKAQGTQRSVVSPSTFDSLRAAAYHEIIQSYADNDRLGAALYYSLVQLQLEPGNEYYIRNADEALTNIIKAVDKHTVHDHIPVESDQLPDSYNQLLRLIDRTTLAELRQVQKSYQANYATVLNTGSSVEKSSKKE